LDWGTRKLRLGAASVQDFDVCGICLNPATEPLCCPKGHVFCKACIYECLLSQKQFIKKQQEKFAKQEEDSEKGVSQSEMDKQAQEMEKFEKLESSVVVKAPSGFNKKKSKITEPIKNAPFTPGVSTKLVIVSDKDKKQKKDSKTKEEDDEAKAKALPCFWIPNLTPEQPSEAKISAPNTFTVCPTGHPLRLKHLTPIQFTARLVDDKEDKPKVSKSSGRYRCYSCSKELTNTNKLSCLRRCGHVMCKACADTIVKSDHSCTCGKRNKDKDIVALAQGGTGFAATGAAVAETKASPAFTCS